MGDDWYWRTGLAVSSACAIGATLLALKGFSWVPAITIWVLAASFGLAKVFFRDGS